MWSIGYRLLMMYSTWWSHFSLFSNSKKKHYFKPLKHLSFMLWRQFFLFVLMGTFSFIKHKEISFLSFAFLFFLLARSTHIVNNQHFPLYLVLRAASFLFLLHLLFLHTHVVVGLWWCDVLGDENSFLFVHILFLQMFVCCLVFSSLVFSV